MVVSETALDRQRLNLDLGIDQTWSLGDLGDQDRIQVLDKTGLQYELEIHTTKLRTEQS